MTEKVVIVALIITAILAVLLSAHDEYHKTRRLQIESDAKVRVEMEKTRQLHIVEKAKE
jgi:hypothetical protein